MADKHSGFFSDESFTVNSAAAQQVVAALTAFAGPFGDSRPEKLIGRHLHEQALRVLLYWHMRALSDLANERNQSVNDLLQDRALFIAKEIQKAQGSST